MREIKIVEISSGIYKVISKKIKKGKEKTDVYIVDLKSNYCSCRKWFYSKSGKKICGHIKSVIQILRSKGKKVKFNKKQNSYEVY